MILRILLFGLMAFASCGFGAFAWRATHMPTLPAPPQIATAPARPASPPPPVLIAVLAASRDLHAGSILRPEDLVARSVADAQDAERDTQSARVSLDGAMLRRALTHGQAISHDDVLIPGDHGFLAAILSPGMRAVAIGSDQLISDVGLLAPGDRVDLILTEASDAGGDKLPRSVSARTVLSDVRILAIGQQLLQAAAPRREDPGTSASITVEVSPIDTQRLMMALRLGKVALALRPAQPFRTFGNTALATAHAQADATSPAATKGSDVLRTSNDLSAVHVFDGDGADKEFKF